MKKRAAVERLLLAAALLLATSPAAAAPRKAPTAKPLAKALSGGAKADYDAGKVLASDGDFAGALIKFNSAHEQSRDPRLLWNIAFCEKNLRHYSKVIAALHRYVAEGTGYLTDKDEKDAQDLIQTIEPFTTKVTFVVSELGARIFVDESLVGESPLSAPVVLDIGERRLRVMKEGYRPYEKTLPVGGSAAVVVEVKLEKEVHEGRIAVNAPASATVEVDGKAMGSGKIDVTVPTGGHQLRVTAQGRRPYQTEVVVQDKETRVVEVLLEQLVEPEKPKIRVAVGCDGPEPLGPDDGLVLYLDGPDVVPPVNVKKKWSDELGRNVVTYVEYATAPGVHRVRIRIPDCDPLEAQVTVDAVKGADLKGALPSDTPALLGGPQGTPGHWRLGLDLWLFEPSLNSGGTFRITDMPDAYAGRYGAATGVAFSGAYIGRWFGMSLQGARGSGTVRRATYESNYALPTEADVNASEVLFRSGFRMPFAVAALNLGPEVGFLEFDVEKVRTGKGQGVFGLWTAFDIQPVCDWGMRALVDVAYATGMSHDDSGPTDNAGSTSNNAGGGGPISSLQFGLFWEPNARCRRERATDFGLRSGGS